MKRQYIYFNETTVTTYLNPIESTGVLRHTIDSLRSAVVMSGSERSFTQGAGSALAQLRCSWIPVSSSPTGWVWWPSNVWNKLVTGYTQEKLSGVLIIHSPRLGHQTWEVGRICQSVQIPLFQNHAEDPRKKNSCSTEMSGKPLWKQILI